MKKGMAIPIVLIFATIMSIVSMFLLKNAKSYNRQNQTSFAQLQSYFIARAGVEHAMLKIKYLNRELYDAICLSQGRNPLFDFSQIKNNEKPWEAIKSYNPGPIFLYTKNAFERNGIYTIDLNIKINNEENYQNKWLKVFESDITSISDDNKSNKNNNIVKNEPINRVLDFGNQNHMKAIKDLMGKQQFKEAQYFVSNLGIFASEVKEDSNKKVDNSVIVEFQVNSIFKNARDEDFNYEIKKTVKVSRD